VIRHVYAERTGTAPAATVSAGVDAALAGTEPASPEPANPV
jgi:hypothetical protein